MNTILEDTIAAIATPAGKGGVAMIRISGTKAKQIGDALTQKKLVTRYAHYAAFYDQQNEIIDTGLALFFPNPASFTGEDIVEIQAHGSPILMDILLKRIIELGGRLASAGEFSQRAFLNNKLDLAQAEAIADLIESSTLQSARSAQKSMQGVFSKQINQLVEELIELRIYVEAAIDFVDEEIDFLTDGVVANRIEKLIASIDMILKVAQQGRLLRDGMTIVLAGKPNAGKSSLLNALAGHDAAIVTDIAGTTRDILKEYIQLDGMPLHIIDTAGLRDSDNIVEQEGVRRAYQEIHKADKVLWLIDINDPEPADILDNLPNNISLTKIYNKIDLNNMPAKIIENDQSAEIYISIKHNIGMELLTEHLKQSVGFNVQADDVFIARRRHIDALNHALEYVKNALKQLKSYQAGELVAEDLKGAQQHLSEITGIFTTDDLLGKIFSSFCIGK